MLQHYLSTSILALSFETLVSLRFPGILVLVALSLYAFWLKILYVAPPSSGNNDQDIPELQLPSLQSNQSFFERRFNFINDGFKATSSSIYQLTLLGSKTIVLSGAEARQVFMRERGLNIYDSFFMLLGNVCYLFRGPI